MAASAKPGPTLEARSIVTTRVFDAPRALVFEAWSDPKHLAEWWGPTGFTTTTHRFEFKPGGVWRFVMHGPDGTDYQNLITFDEIVTPEKLVYRHGGSAEGEPVRFNVTIAFEALGEKTRVTMHAVFPTAAERDRVAEKYGAVEGAQQTLARLAQHLTQMR